MKCKYCHGTGKIDGSVYPCDKCNGTGRYEPFDADVELDKLYPTEQTNDEWRKTCSAEEFVEFLAGVAHAGAYEVRNCNTNGMLQTQNTDFWLAWLKEKHNEFV